MVDLSYAQLLCRPPARILAVGRKAKQQDHNVLRSNNKCTSGGDDGGWGHMSQQQCSLNAANPLAAERKWKLCAKRSWQGSVPVLIVSYARYAAKDSWWCLAAVWTPSAGLPETAQQLLPYNTKGRQPKTVWQHRLKARRLMNCFLCCPLDTHFTPSSQITFPDSVAICYPPCPQSNPQSLMLQFNFFFPSHRISWPTLLRFSCGQSASHTLADRSPTRSSVLTALAMASAMTGASRSERDIE